ncbi:MAG: hypothetical protein ACRDRR_16990 [Pseudonocardiaceae bacterium]
MVSDLFALVGDPVALVGRFACPAGAAKRKQFASFSGQPRL